MGKLNKTTIWPLIIMLSMVFILGSVVSAEEPKKEKKAEIEWLAYDAGLVKAKEEKKQVVIDFTAKWCGWCKKMEKEAFIDPTVVEMMNNDFVAVRVDGDSQKELNIDGYIITEHNLTRSEFGVTGYPAFWFLESDGTKIGPIKGYLPTDKFIEALNFVKDRKYAAPPPQEEGK